MLKKIHTEQLNLVDTGYFTPLVTDYVAQDAFFEPFIQAFPSPVVMGQAFQAKEKQTLHRAVLVDALKAQYVHLPNTEKALLQIGRLLEDTTFTVCTAHQPILFLGPLYVIYKTVHAIQLATHLNQQFPNKQVVPVFYMGTEDHDIDEIAQCSFNGEQFVWEPQQVGACGRMKTEHMANLLARYKSYWNLNIPHEKAWVEALTQAYDGKKTLAEATRYLLHHLFGDTGLLILDADAPALKKLLVPVMQEELFGVPAIERIQSGIQTLQDRYHVQANPRAINLFYLNDAGRSRIEQDGELFKVVGTDYSWNKTDLQHELNQHPERFSPNVILRPLYQEIILPNVAFIGGGGELAYWLQLKANFDYFKVAFPLLFLRNSLLFVSASQQKKMTQKKWTISNLFLPVDTWLNYQIQGAPLLHRWEETHQALQALMEQYTQGLNAEAPNYVVSVKAHQAKMERVLQRITQKTKAAEKRKWDDARNSFESLQGQLFPNRTLQERTENGPFLLKEIGENWLDVLMQVQDPYSQQFTVFRIAE
ncbi:MAG: bacillithiol biosynthesis cysteine-adding enzyme BshC [Chitinophagaceae bacterium]